MCCRPAHRFAIGPMSDLIGKCSAFTQQTDIGPPVSRRIMPTAGQSNLYQYKLDSFATAIDHALQGNVGVKAGIVL